MDVLTTSNVRQVRPFYWLVDVQIDGKVAIPNVSVGLTHNGRYAVRLSQRSITLSEELFAAVRRAAIEAVQA